MSERMADVFDQMREVEKRLETVKARASRNLVYPVTRDEALWLCERVENVLRTIKDAQVTYGLIDTDKPVEQMAGPMMTERGALVAALAEPGRWPDQRTPLGP